MAVGWWLGELGMADVMVGVALSLLTGIIWSRLLCELGVVIALILSVLCCCFGDLLFSSALWRGLWDVEAVLSLSGFWEWLCKSGVVLTLMLSVLCCCFGDFLFLCLMVRTVGRRSLTFSIWLLRVTVRNKGCTNSDTVHLVLLLLRLTACIRLMVRTVQLRGLTLTTIMLLMDDLLLCGLVSFLPDKLFSLRYKLLNLRS